MLAVENITKKFSGVTALENVSMELHPGKVNAIIGENGAGKSTLMKILSGVYPGYEGRILFNGEPVHFSGPRDAQDKGIAIIHQELNLIPWLSIAENIFLGRELTGRWGGLAHSKMRRITSSLLESLKMKLDPATPVYKLKVGQQQGVEIAKALLDDAKVVIMDEPTSAISESEVEVLFGIIEDLKSRGKVIVYISHKLDELFRIADRYVVMRDGRTVASGNMSGLDRAGLIAKMTGSGIRALEKTGPAGNPEPLLSAENICLEHPVRRGRHVVDNLSFSLGRGEILGLFGLMGAGRTELLETLFGLHPRRSSGTVRIGKETLAIGKPADAIRAGMALVPEDRKKDGLVLGMDVRTNICLTSLSRLEVGGLLSRQKGTALARKYIRELRIKTSSEKQLARRLSGGNQQKIVLAKWLALHPKILLLDEPTRGIDVHAKNELYKLMLDLAADGLGILMVSSELPEILAVSDRVLVMAEGRLTAEIPAAEASRDRILQAAIPSMT